VLPVEPRYEVRFLPGRLYRRNVSLNRLRNHREIARSFRKTAPTLPAPDLILCSLPPLELCVESVRFGRARGVPVLLDVRDPWPDVFYRVLPKPLRRLGPLLFSPFVRQASTALRAASGIVAVSQAYLNWALRLAGRAPGPRDTVITHGYPTSPTVSESDVAALRTQLGVRDGMTVLWFVGSFAWYLDIPTIIDAARRLAQRTDLLFILSGAGERENQLRAQADGLPNVRFTGWVDQIAIARLSRIATAGLAAYVPDAAMSLTNKLFEYLSAGLPVLLGLRGEAEAIVREWDCGITYRPGDARDLARAVVAIADDPSLRSRLAAGSARAFRTAFAEEIIYPRFVRLLEAEAQKGALGA